MIRTVIQAVLVLSLVSCAMAPSSVAPASSAVPSGAPPIWAGLQPGQYAVGFKSWHLRAQDADWKYAAPHLVQINVWYPAVSEGKAMTYRDYLLLSLTETTADELTEKQREAGVADFTKFLKSEGLSDLSTRTLLDATMYARRDARSLALKRFPIVFVVQGNGQSAASQAVLSEFLTSHGYIVVTTPSITRLTGPIQSTELVARKALEQTEDIDRAASAIGDSPNAVNIPISLVSHSFGARAALIYAMHHPTNALVSLDGGIGTATATASMLSLKELDLTKPVPPILHFYEMNEDRMNPDFRLLRSLRTPDLQLVRMNSMMHVHFTTDGFGALLVPELARVTRAGPDLRKEVVAMAQQTLAFLDKQWAPVRPVS
jgi:pimeloyl-ACP methyl ester carboxylesterase